MLDNTSGVLTIKQMIALCASIYAVKIKNVGLQTHNIEKQSYFYLKSMHYRIYYKIYILRLILTHTKVIPLFPSLLLLFGDTLHLIRSSGH